MKKFLIYLGIVIAAVFVVDYSVGSFLDKHFSLVSGGKAADAYNNCSELVLLGPSEMANQYDTRIIRDRLGVTAYNYGSGGQNIYYQYALLNVMINHAQKPKWVLLELSNIDFYDTPGWNTEKLDALYPMYEMDDSLRSIVDLQGYRSKFILRTFKCYKHNSQPLVYLGSLLKNKQNDGCYGYVAIEPVDFSEKLDTVSDIGKKQFDLLKIEYLYRFIRMCKNNGIQLVVIDAPYFEFHNGIEWKNKLKSILIEEGVPYFDYDNDPFFTAHREWYYNRVHFNKYGAQEYTKRIIPDLRSIIKKVK